MLRKLLLLSFLFVSINMAANDGAFYTYGNQLIPMIETDISIEKEILSIQRVEQNFVEIRVEYTFFNPKEAKTLLVGFEAPSPYGDVDTKPIDGKHPYISDFTVQMNAKALDYQTALVTDSLYFQNGEIQSKTEEQVLNLKYNNNYRAFYYVYHFEALFQTGKNTITHTYKCKLSGGVMFKYDFEYILTAATRWAGNQIADFTLLIDLGEFQDLMMDRSFFEDLEGWSLNGKMIPGDYKDFSGQAVDQLRFAVREGPITFKKNNFQPKGELRFFSPFDWGQATDKEFDAKEDQLPYALGRIKWLINSVDETSYKILRNLPYARRGYIFKTKSIQDYYESMDWYQPNPNYVSDLEDLTKVELEWLEKVNDSWGQ